MIDAKLNDNANIQPFLTDNVLFKQQYSWVYVSRFDNSWTIGVQHLSFQGAEYRLMCNSRQQADQISQALFNIFHPDKKPSHSHRMGTTYDVNVDNCLCPFDLLKFAQTFAKDIRLIFTPTSPAVRDCYFKDQRNLVSDHTVHCNQDKDIFCRYWYIPYNTAVQALIASNTVVVPQAPTNTDDGCQTNEQSTLFTGESKGIYQAALAILTPELQPFAKLKAKINQATELNQAWAILSHLIEAGLVKSKEIECTLTSTKIKTNVKRAYALV